MSEAASTVRWTTPEAWLIAEIAKYSLVATFPDGRRIAAADTGPFRATLDVRGNVITLVLAIDADTVTVELVTTRPSGHRWRSGWMLELERGEDSWMLSLQQPRVRIDRARRGTFRVHARIQDQAITRTLAGATETFSVADVACYRFTRQSTVSEPTTPATPELWSRPTQRERAPWWELDLGTAHYLAWLRIDLAAPAHGVRVVLRAYGFLMPDGTAPPHSEIDSELIVEGPYLALIVATGVIARYLRIELAGEGTLAVTGVEALATELFAATLETALRRAFALHRDRPLFLERDGDRYVPWLTYNHVWMRAQALANGLARRLEPRAGRIVLAVVLRNRPEWVMADLAALARGYVIVPLSPDDPDDRLALIFERANPACVICESAIAARVRALAPAALVIDCDAELAALLEPGPTPPPAEPRPPDDLYAVLFTSGSTGVPKGAMRSYATFYAMVKSYAAGHSPRHLSFQPLSHLSERMYLPSLLIHGGQIGFSQGGVHLLDELRALEPTTVGTVPRLFEVLHASYQRRLRAAIVAEPATPRGVLEARELAEARATLGTRVFAVSVGSAPVSAEVFGFMKRCFAGLWVSEGYGSTEVGTIAIEGKIAADMQVKLVPLRDAPAPEPGAPERGEIFVLSPHRVTGYLGDPAATAAAFDAEGYFATGDLGERDRDGLVRVIGRVRNTVKLAHGEFVSAERIEAALGTAPNVDRIFVYAEHGATGVAALVQPQQPAAPEVILAALRGAARGLAAYEIPRGVVIAPEPFSVENGLLTASGKLARGTLAKRFGAELAAIAAGGATSAIETTDPVDDDLRARVVRIAGRVLGRAITADEPVAAAAIDSLASAEILEALSEELGRDVPLAWWFEARTLAELATRLGHFADAEHAANELAIRDRGVAIPEVVSHARELRHVLLTGATGFLGAHLVESLQARGLEVTCLVRAPDDAAAKVRLAAALASRRIPGTARAIAGDLADPELRDRLAALDVDAIVHAGATVSWLASYAAVRGPNVLGTHAVVAHAAARGLPVHFVSTISTAPSTGDESTRLDFASAAAATPYALSKWLAEDHVQRTGAAGLPITIYRPAMIAGHTRRGIGNPDDYLNRYMTGCADLGLYIDDDAAIIDMTPVDFVAEAIAALVVQPATGRTYHLANVDRSLTYAGLGRALVAAGLAIRPAGYAAFRAALVEARASRLHALAAFFPERIELGMGPWPHAATDAVLATLGVSRPTIDPAIIARYVAGRRGT
ncbi:MAG: thioester reductase domain-containing protein [Kofleriaceae bacterium]